MFTLKMMEYVMYGWFADVPSVIHIEQVQFWDHRQVRVQVVIVLFSVLLLFHQFIASEHEVVMFHVCGFHL